LWGVLILVSQPEFGFKTRFFNWVLAGFWFFFFFSALHGGCLTGSDL
jgi:uncharacterized membrane protein YphA (DoxX/SURF4 family)